MKQRLGIAEVLVKSPRAVFLDEPTLGIDPDGAIRILELIKGLNRERNLTVMLSSHQLQQVQAICSRIGIIVKGRLIVQGQMDDLGRAILKGTAVELSIGGWAWRQRPRKRLRPLMGSMKLKSGPWPISPLHQRCAARGRIIAGAEEFVSLTASF